MMDPILDQFEQELARAAPRAPTRRFCSNLTGTWIKSEEAIDPGYWVKHLRHTVRFADNLTALLEDPNRVLLEVGPGKTLTTFAQQHSERKPSQALVHSLRHPKDGTPDTAFMLGALGHLWNCGLTLDWRRYYDGERRVRVPLPTYAFQRKRFWIEPGKGAFPSETARSGQLSRLPVDDWFYQPSWRQSFPKVPSADEIARLEGTFALVFVDELGIGTRVCSLMRETGARRRDGAAGARVRRGRSELFPDQASRGS